LQAIYPHLLLASLEHFAATTKRATAAQREAGRGLIQLLGEENANLAIERAPVRQQKLEQLKSEFMAAETLRQARLTEHRRRKLARRERLGSLRKLGIGNNNSGPARGLRQSANFANYRELESPGSVR
jgi:hypothetical protein